ncbi:MAG TPA: hypothetical protein VF549_15620 [Solirubrobacteraceae bacterium]|jgi:hypothetical protein
MTPQPLTLIAPLKSQDPDSLETLEGIMAERGRAVFESSPSTHFAALVMLGDRQGRRRLFLSADYDGDLAHYLDELWRAAPNELDAMFSYCEGYTGRDGFLDFVRRRSHKSQTYFVAFRDETANGIKEKARKRAELERRLGDDPQTVAPFVDAVAATEGPPTAAERATGRARAFVDGLRSRAHDRFWQCVIAIARLIATRMGTGASRSASADLGQKLDRETDLRYQRVQVGQAQNQMTNISWVRPGRGPIVRVSLALANYMVKHAFPPGDLAGVKTVHFARWSLIDGGKGLLFEGNFDGTWENYMGDFTDRVAWGLDALWGHTEGYPPAGMKDIWAFKRYIRELMYPPAMVYMAYPELTVLNTVRDREIVATLESGRRGSLREAVSRL